MAVQTEARPVPLDTSGAESDGLIHVVCCDDDLALCGTPVPGDLWMPRVSTPDDCAVCRDLDEAEAPCSPACWNQPD